MHRLALGLGQSLEWVLDLTDEELETWIGYMRLEPFGPLRDDLRSGTTAAILVNTNRAKGARAVGPADLFSTLRPFKPRAKSKGGGASIWARIVGGMKSRGAKTDGR